MANLEFYATCEDLIDLLSFIFEDGSFRVFESYSRYDTDLREFHTPTQIQAAYTVGTPVSTLLSIWAPSVSSAFITQHITLDPRRTGGARFRYAASGWGLISLVLGGPSPVRSTFASSNLSHNSEARARLWESTYLASLGSVSSWDWRQLEVLSRRLRYHISRRLAVAKVGSRPVLRHAHLLVEQGYSLQ